MMTLYDFLRAGHVKRWHIVNTACQQSIAEHSFLVAVIAMHLHKAMGGSENEVHQTAVWGLFHDAIEIRTGDIPTPAKRLLREADGQVAGEPDIFDRLDVLLLPDAPYFNEGTCPSEMSIACVKMADAIEAAHWIRENGLGRHAEIVASGCWRRVEDLTAKYGWYKEVNEVMMALGMPYISREERITPP
jgi:5'-deoxynucleotidase YfbR-like HD superfamily hydrolase